MSKSTYFFTRHFHSWLHFQYKIIWTCHIWLHQSWLQWTHFVYLPLLGCFHKMVICRLHWIEFNNQNLCFLLCNMHANLFDSIVYCICNGIWLHVYGQSLQLNTQCKLVNIKTYCFFGQPETLFQSIVFNNGFKVHLWQPNYRNTLHINTSSSTSSSLYYNFLPLSLAIQYLWLSIQLILNILSYSLKYVVEMFRIYE